MGDRQPSKTDGRCPGLAEFGWPPEGTAPVADESGTAAIVAAIDRQTAIMARLVDELQKFTLGQVDLVRNGGPRTPSGSRT